MTHKALELRDRKDGTCELFGVTLSADNRIIANVPIRIFPDRITAERIAVALAGSSVLGGWFGAYHGPTLQSVRDRVSAAVDGLPVGG